MLHAGLQKNICVAKIELASSSNSMPKVSQIRRDFNETIGYNYIIL